MSLTESKIRCEVQKILRESHDTWGHGGINAFGSSNDPLHRRVDRQRRGGPEKRFAKDFIRKIFLKHWSAIEKELRDNGIDPIDETSDEIIKLLNKFVELDAYSWPNEVKLSYIKTIERINSLKKNFKVGEEPNVRNS